MKCEIGYIDDDAHLVINTHLEAWGLIQNHKEKGSINIHITNELKDAIGISYRARFFGVDGIFLNESTYTNPNLSSTIAHEVGHYFELDETHQYSTRGKCRKEPISRTRTYPFIQFCPFKYATFSNLICESTGDFLRDTPADPDLSSNFSCNYILTGKTDPWDDHYETPPSGSLPPDTRNIMSYNRSRECRDVFSRLQIAVMLHSVERGKSKNNRDGWKNLKAEFDEYETDNDPLTARQILFGEIQERNFHQQYTTEDIFGNPIWSQCDVDWVRFQPTCSQTFEIKTLVIPGRTKADTKITIYDEDLNQLAQNDNIGLYDKFSKVSIELTQDQIYFIEVENMSNNITGYYNLNITLPPIIGSDILCSCERYEINGLHPGSTVTWTASPSGIVNITPFGNSADVCKISNDEVTLIATVNNACAINPVILSKPITRGITDIYSVSFSNGANEDMYFCTNHTGNQFDYQLSSVPANGSIEYRLLDYPNLNVVYTHPISYPIGSSPISVGSGFSPGWYVLEIKLTTPCGSTDWMGFEVEFVNCAQMRKTNYFRVQASPNPTSSDLYVTIDEEKQEVKSLSTSEKINFVLYDFSRQRAVKNWDYLNNQKQHKLNVAGIRPGQYILVVMKGKYRQSTQIVIK